MIYPHLRSHSQYIAPNQGTCYWGMVFQSIVSQRRKISIQADSGKNKWVQPPSVFTPISPGTNVVMRTSTHETHEHIWPDYLKSPTPMGCRKAKSIQMSINFSEPKPTTRMQPTCQPINRGLHLQIIKRAVFSPQLLKTFQLVSEMATDLSIFSHNVEERAKHQNALQRQPKRNHTG